MLFVLTCALCTAAPAALTDAAPHAPLLAAAPLLLRADPLPNSASSAPLAFADYEPGPYDADHASHLGPMLIVVGAMMAVMMVGMGVYFMRHHSTAAHPLSAGGSTSPAQLAIPVSVARGGGG